MSDFQRNVNGQKWLVFAFDRTTNVPKTGDAANITAKIRKDYAAATATNDTNPDEIEDGYYEFTLTQAETSATVMDILPESSTANIQVIGVPGRVFTGPANHSLMGVNGSGHLSRVTLVDTTTANTDMRGTDGANTTVPDASGTAATLIAASEAAIIAEIDANEAKIDLIPTNPMLDTEDGSSFGMIPDMATATTQAVIQGVTDQFVFTVPNQVDANALTGGGGDDAATIYTYFTNGSNEDAFKATGFATPTNVTDARDAIIAEVNANEAKIDLVPVAVHQTQMTEGYSAVGTAPTLEECMFLILQHLGESSIVSTTKTVKKLDGSATAATFTLDDAADPTSITRAT